MTKETITVTVADISAIWNIIGDLIDLNDQPFRGQARRLLFEIQPEVKYIQDADPEDLESIKDKEIELGYQIAPPKYFPEEYRPILEKLCGPLPEKTSKIKSLLEPEVVE